MASAVGVNTEGLKWGEIKPAYVDAYLRKHEVKVPPASTLEARVKLLLRHYFRTVAEKDILECDKCGGMSAPDDTECPFCGDREEGNPSILDAAKPANDEKAPDSGKQEKAEKPKPKAEKPKAEKSKAEKPKAFSAVEVADAGVILEQTSVEAPELPNGEELPSESAVEKCREVLLKAFAAAPRVKGYGVLQRSNLAVLAFPESVLDVTLDQLLEDGVVEIDDSRDPYIRLIDPRATETTSVEPPAQVVHAVVVQKPAAEDDTAVDVASVDDLNRAVSRVHELRTNMAINAWELGREIADLYDRKLYLQRRDEAGVPKYKSWTQFTTAELGMTVQHCLMLSDVARAFTREEVEKVGVTKLAIVMRLPEGDRAALLERAQAGASRAELQAEASGKTIERDTGRAGKSKGIKAHEKEKRGKKAAELGAKSRPEGAVTAVFPKPRMRVELFARGTEKRAKRLADEPYAEVELVNGQKLKLRLVNAATGLILAVDIERT